MDFKILTAELLDQYREALTESPLEKLDKMKEFDMPVDYFQFYKSVSSVYSSRIEGEDIEFDSFFKHKFIGVQFKPDYTRKADDLYFVKIHPFQNGNGRTARLLEKWFLLQGIGQKAVAVQLEKNYCKNVQDYYKNIRKLGLEYHELDYAKSLDFLLMTVNGIETEG